MTKETFQWTIWIAIFIIFTTTIMVVETMRNDFQNQIDNHVIAINTIYDEIDELKNEKNNSNKEILDIIGTEDRLNLTLNSNFEIKEVSDYIAYFSPDYKSITINGKICEEVACECHKNNPMCLSICYYCEEEEHGTF